MDDKKEVKNQEQAQNLERRDFIKSTALVAVGAGASALLGPVSASAQGLKQSSLGQGPYPAEGMAVSSTTSGHTLLKFQRRALGPKDVAIKLHYCGVCHSDIHTAHGDWRPAKYPLITGHELAGEVVAVGSSVSKFKVGSRVGVGCMVDSCGHCAECDHGFEQYCENGPIFTYGSQDRDGSITQGGYSTFTVVNENFVISVPDSVDLAHAGPMMCAGITVYSPFRRWNVGPGKKVGVVGFGGLGHMATMIATAMGAEVTVITTSPEKAKDARRLGAKQVLINNDSADFSKFKKSLDFVIDTTPARINFDRITTLLKRDATLCRVGVGNVLEPNQLNTFSLIGARNSFAGSMIGGIRETQELVDFCALHKIKPEIEKIQLAKVDEAWSKVTAKKARYRFVLEMPKA